MSNEVRQVSTTTSKEGTSITPVARRLATRSDVPQLQATASRHSAIRLRKKCFRPLLTYGSGNDVLCVNDLRCIVFLEAFVVRALSSYMEVGQLEEAVDRRECDCMGCPGQKAFPRKVQQGIRNCTPFERVGEPSAALSVGEQSQPWRAAANLCSEKLHRSTCSSGEDSHLPC